MNNGLLGFPRRGYRNLTFHGLREVISIASGLIQVHRPRSSIPSISWETYTPNITAEMGSFTTVSATMRYRIDGKTLHFNMTITITDNGTASGSVIASLPVAARSGDKAIVPGRNDVNGGAMLQGIVQGSSMAIFKYDNTGPGSTGEVMRMSGAYEVA
jgi:hypothetical protein